MRRGPMMLAAILAAATILLSLMGNVATSSLHLSHRYIPWMWAAIAVLGTVTIAGAVVERRRSQRQSVGSGDVDLIEVAEQLARSVRRQWEAESAQRRLYDPFP